MCTLLPYLFKGVVEKQTEAQRIRFSALDNGAEQPDGNVDDCAGAGGMISPAMRAPPPGAMRDAR